jgi:hypothetical protein
MVAGVVVGRVAQLWRHPVKSLAGERGDALELGPGGVVGDRAWGVHDAASGTILTAKRLPRLLHVAARTTAAGVEVEVPGTPPRAAGDPVADAALSAWLGREVRLERAVPGARATYEAPSDVDDDASPLDRWASPPGRFVDAAEVHLLTTASLAAAGRVAGPGSGPDGADGADARRFRPNVVVAVDGHGWVEDAWQGVVVVVGAAVLEVGGGTTRCSMVTRAQDGSAGEHGGAGEHRGGGEEGGGGAGGQRPGALVAAPDLHRALRREHDAVLGVYARVVAAATVRVGDEVVARLHPMGGP